MMSGRLVAPMMNTFFLLLMPSISVRIWLITRSAAPPGRGEGKGEKEREGEEGEGKRKGMREGERGEGRGKEEIMEGREGRRREEGEGGMSRDRENKQARILEGKVVYVYTIRYLVYHNNNLFYDNNSLQ